MLYPEIVIKRQYECVLCECKKTRAKYINKYYVVAYFEYLKRMVSQVGNGKSHSLWDRPESITTKQNSYKVDDTHPGSDVAGEYAAAMAAGYLAFKDKG